MPQLLRENRTFVVSLLAAWLLSGAALPALGQTVTAAANWQSSKSANTSQRLLNYSTTAPLLGTPTAITVSFYCDPLKTKDSEPVRSVVSSAKLKNVNKGQ